MRPHLAYLRKVILHKLYVLVAGWRLGVPLRQLIVHDLSKFSRAEWAPYVDRFHRGVAGKMDKTNDSKAFKAAWRHHYMNNPHHPEFWLLVNQEVNTSLAMGRSRKGVTHLNANNMAYQMPDKYMREMVADWLAAGRAYKGSWDIKPWYLENHARLLMHPQTRVNAEFLLGFQRCEICNMLCEQCGCELAEALGWDPRSQVA